MRRASPLRGSGPRFVHVDVHADHLESLTRAKPVSALAELIWNALDADADRVSVQVNDNALATPASIEVIDNGNGIAVDEAERAFGNLGGSWKREKRVTTRSRKKMHGRDGKGRFKAFALGHDVVWETVFLDADDTPLQYAIKGQSSRLQDFEISALSAASPGRGRGTRVVIDNLQDTLGVLSDDGAAGRQLAELFALYLRNYPATEILYRGQRVDPQSVQRAYASVPLARFIAADGTPVDATVEIVEWTFAKKERRICLCDNDGFALHEVEAGIRPGSDFNFTVYLRSDYIGQLHRDNRLGLEGLNSDLLRVIEDARGALRAYFRRRKAESAAELVQQWKDEGVYPFSGDPSDALETARREVFDICALSVHTYLDSFRDGEKKDRQFTLRMLKVALDENPESIKRILTEVLGLPNEKQNELAELLQYTTLSAIIGASKMVTDRLQFLSGLQDLLFQVESKRSLKERTQLHRMLESETWIFGEEYLLTNSDENLNTVLHKHLASLRPSEKRSRKKNRKSVLRDDGTQGVIDLLLAREIPTYASVRREFLVVELKRPSQKIDLGVKAQIESYAMAVANDERFDMTNTRWTFLAVSNEITDEAARTVRQQAKAFGFFHDEPNLRIGLATWAEILNGTRSRLEAFRIKLDYTATKDHGVALLHNKYAKYVPAAESPGYSAAEELDAASDPL